MFCSNDISDMRWTKEDSSVANWSLFVVLLLHISRSDTLCPESCHCYRNQTVIECPNQGLRSLPRDIPSSVIEFYFHNNQLDTVPDNAFKYASQMKLLDLSRNKIKQVYAGAFIGLEELEILHLEDNALTSIDAEVFCKTPSL